MWTLKSLSSVPTKTVRPTPTMPARTSSIGMRDVEAGSVARSDVRSRPIAAALNRKFMSL